MIDQDLIQTVYSNNTFDISALEKSLEIVKQNSFKYLYNLQLSLTGYKRFDFKFRDLTPINLINKELEYYPRKYVVFVDDNFIDERKRLEFKKSRFFDKELNLFDVASNPQIFSSIYMVFIDGKFFDCINILCKEDKTYMIFDIAEGVNTAGIPKNYFDQLYEQNVDISIIFVPNCPYGLYNTNNNILRKYINNLSLSRFNIANNLDTVEKYITFINSNDLLFGSVITDTENSKDMLRFYNNDVLTYNNKVVHLNVFGFRHLLDQKDILGSEKYFDIEIQDMPVPTENIMIFRNINGKKYFAHDITLKMYYPNIYEIIGNDQNDDLTLYIFYSNKTEHAILKYANELELYYKFTQDILEKYKNNTIPEIIKSYEPELYKYDIKDFTQSEYYPDHLNYKIEDFRSWICANNENLREYLIRQVAKNTSYYLDISKIDLASRFRLDNKREISYPDQQETFNEPRYVFVFRKDLKIDFYELRFFIDGKLYIIDKVYKTQDYEYYYIPVSLITPTSIIEIEKLDSYFYSSRFKFTDMNDIKNINLKNKYYHIHANDIFIIDAETMHYIPRDQYKFVTIRDKEQIDVDPTSFIELSSFSIVPLNENIVNKNLSIEIKKQSYYKEWQVNNINRAYDIEVFDLDSNNDKRYFRIFRNNLLLPMHVYDIEFGDQLSDKFIVNLTMTKMIGDSYIIDCTPFKYKQIYYEKEIPENGFIDLKNIIDKPFDLKWYDIYLNGLRLNKNQIRIISPTKIILTNVPTRKNLFILQKDRDEPEIFSIGDCVNSPSDMLWDNIPELRTAILADNLIIDTMDDIITASIDELARKWIKYFELVLKYRYINPDNPDEILDEDIEKYPELFLQPGNIMFINPDDAPALQATMDIFPKIY